MEVNLPRSLRVAGDYEGISKSVPLYVKAERKGHTGDDGALWTVLSDQAGRVARCRHDNDGSSVLLMGSSNGSHCNSFAGFRGSRCESAELIEERWIAD